MKENKQKKSTELKLTENQIERFFDTLVKIYEDKYNVSINYVLKEVKES